MKGLYAIPLGKNKVTLKSTKETFNIIKPVTSLHNLVIGTMFLWLEGDAICENEVTGHKAILDLKPKGFF